MPVEVAIAACYLRVQKTAPLFEPKNGAYAILNIDMI